MARRIGLLMCLECVSLMVGNLAYRTGELIQIGLSLYGDRYEECIDECFVDVARVCKLDGEELEMRDERADSSRSKHVREVMLGRKARMDFKRKVGVMGKCSPEAIPCNTSSRYTLACDPLLSREPGLLIVMAWVQAFFFLVSTPLQHLCRN